GPCEGGRGRVGKSASVAQREPRIGSVFTGRKRWAWLCSGHGSKSFFIVPLRRDQPARSHNRVPMGREGGNTGRRRSIRAQRAGIIPCLSSQNFIRLEKT